MKVTKLNWERYCEDNFLDENVSDVIERLTKDFKEIDVELKGKGNIGELIIKIKLREK